MNWFTELFSRHQQEYNIDSVYGLDLPKSLDVDSNEKRVELAKKYLGDKYLLAKNVNKLPKKK